MRLQMRAEAKGIGTIGLAVSFLAPFSAAFVFIINHFFDSGVTFLDAGWFADLMWQKKWTLPNPQVVRVTPDFPPPSYYGIHFSPILALISGISWFLPLDHVRVFAAFVGTSHGLMGVAMWSILMHWRASRGALWSAIAAVFSVGFALNGVSLSVTTYPHFEILVPGLVLLALLFLMQERRLAAWSVGFLALLVREDVGFHFVALLGPLIVFRRFGGHSLWSQKDLLFFAVVSLAYSVAAIAFQRWLYPALDTFQWVYAGRPAFDHLTLGFLSHRLSVMIETRPYVWLPLLAIVFSAAILRNACVAIGAIAFLPWLFLQLSAVRDTPGTLAIHYPYPLILGIGWVALAYSMCTSHVKADRRYDWAAALLGIVIATTFVRNNATGDFFRGATPSEFTWRSEPTTSFATALADSIPFLGNLRADTAIISLLPNALSTTAWLRPQDWDRREPDKNVDTLVYFKSGFEREKAAAQRAAMQRAFTYSVPGTNILIASKDRIDPAAPVTALLHLEPYALVGFYQQESNLAWAATRFPAIQVFQCGDRTMHMDVIGFALWPGASNATDAGKVLVRVKLNGKPYEQLEFSREVQVQGLTVPVTCVDDVMTVAFEYDHLVVPSDVTDSRDNRALGIGIRGEIRLQR